MVEKHQYPTLSRALMSSLNPRAPLSLNLYEDPELKSCFRHLPYAPKKKKTHNL